MNEHEIKARTDAARDRLHDRNPDEPAPLAARAPENLDTEGKLRWQLAQLGLRPPEHVKLDVPLDGAARCDCGNVDAWWEWKPKGAAWSRGIAPAGMAVEGTRFRCPACERKSKGASALNDAFSGLDLDPHAAEVLRRKWTEAANVTFERRPTQDAALRALQLLLGSNSGVFGAALYGPSGAGKTLLALRAVRQAADLGWSAKVLTESQWINSRRKAFSRVPGAEDWADRLRAEIVRVDLVLYDDALSLQDSEASQGNFIAQSRQELFEVIRRKHYIVTTNRRPDSWAAAAGGRVQAWLQQAQHVEVLCEDQRRKR